MEKASADELFFIVIASLVSLGYPSHLFVPSTVLALICTFFHLKPCFSSTVPIKIKWQTRRAHPWTCVWINFVSSKAIAQFCEMKHNAISIMLCHEPSPALQFRLTFNLARGAMKISCSNELRPRRYISLSWEPVSGLIRTANRNKTFHVGKLSKVLRLFVLCSFVLMFWWKLETKLWWRQLLVQCCSLFFRCHITFDIGFRFSPARRKEKLAGEDNEKLSTGWQSSLLNKLMLNLRSRWTLCQHARINYQIATRSRFFFLARDVRMFSLRTDGKIIIFVCLHNQHSASRALDREIKAAENRCLCVGRDATENLCESDAVCFSFAFDWLTSQEMKSFVFHSKCYKNLNFQYKLVKNSIFCNVNNWNKK